MIDHFKPTSVRAGSGIEQNSSGAYECVRARFVEPEIPRKAKIGESIPIVRATSCCAAFRIARKKCTHRGFVRENRCSVNAAGGNLRVSRQDHFGVLERAGAVPRVARHASHFDECCYRIRERSDGTNQIERVDVLCKARPALETVLARDNQLRIGEGDLRVPHF